MAFSSHISVGWRLRSSGAQPMTSQKSRMEDDRTSEGVLQAGAGGRQHNKLRFVGFGCACMSDASTGGRRLRP